MHEGTPARAGRRGEVPGDVKGCAAGTAAIVRPRRRGYSDSPMAITVKYFASLRERMGRGEDRLHPPLPATVEAVWERVGGGSPLAGNVLCAVNLEYAEADHRVADGDEVAFFPPVTGG